MKRTSKYVGLDVHQATTVVAVRERSGRVIFRGVLPTEAGPLVEFFRGLAGTVRIALAFTCGARSAVTASTARYAHRTCRTQR